LLEGSRTRVFQAARLNTRRDSTVLIRDHPSSPLNFLLFLVPRKFRKFRKFTTNHPFRPH